jgi:hypothetical protein
VDILHFCGHSGIDPHDYIVFETTNGGAHFLDLTALERLISPETKSVSSIRVVFVASCHSKRIGEMFLSAGAQNVVCVRRDAKVMDRSSIVFARAFYHALLSGCRYAFVTLGDAIHRCWCGVVGRHAQRRRLRRVLARSNPR